MHDIILIWVLSWIALFTAVVYWPRKPLLPVEAAIKGHKEKFSK